MQWCHGAPGIVASLAALAPGDDEHERLLLAGGELTWRAGPLAKGANLCHGTAGNGYAFLALFERTGDELWLERARAFAMHAAAQVARARAELRAAAATRSGRAIPGRRSTSPTACEVGEHCRCPEASRWSVPGSNGRPSACKADALPTELTPQNGLVKPKLR